MVLLPGAAHAAPPAGQGKPGSVQTVSGMLQSINTKARKLVVADGHSLRYDSNDIVVAQHMRDEAMDSDGDGVVDTVYCGLSDRGSYETFAVFVQRGIPAEVSATVYSARDDVSVIWVVGDSCDGIIDGADADTF
ncbi:hypothetical protein CAE01nite_12390 [Cellulomonas aerilata]|uniref:Uncharacterized protein n=2 Tax=Cellulomonas aerilata TaxID=515326 RepID=A0A512DAK9_9CELL|nr:hypothetical protein CAE01nite_12390 [Cellulomonas aerilata]